MSMISLNAASALSFIAPLVIALIALSLANSIPLIVSVNCSLITLLVPAVSILYARPLNTAD